MSVKSRHLLLLFYKISTLIYAFLPALQNIKDASVVEVCSSSLQPTPHSFLDCISLVVVTSQVFFQEPKPVVVCGGQIQTVGWVEEQFLAILCSSIPISKWGTQQEQTFRYPKISIISWTAWCPTAHYTAFLCYTFVLSDELVNYLLVAFSRSSSRLTTVQLISNVHVSILKMFYPPYDTAGTHAGIFIHTTT